MLASPNLDCDVVFDKSETRSLTKNALSNISKTALAVLSGSTLLRGVPPTGNHKLLAPFETDGKLLAESALDLIDKNRQLHVKLITIANFLLLDDFDGNGVAL